VPLTRHSANKSLCRMSLHQHSAKSICFAECHYTSTQQRAYTLPSADLDTRQRAYTLPSASLRHSANIRHRFFRRHVYFFPESRTRHSAKSLPSARQKTLGKETFADPFFAVSSLPSATLGKRFAECLCYFAECVRHSANEASPVVLAVIAEFSGSCSPAI
jgi:hypothetical protein